MRIETYPPPLIDPSLIYLVNGDKAHRIRHNGNTLCSNLSYPDAYYVQRNEWDKRQYPVCKKCGTK